MSFYEVKVVTRAGVVLATFDADQGDGDTRQKASVEEVSWVLNEPGVVRIRVPLFHPAAPQIQALKRELQVWRDGVLIHWVVPVQAEPDGHSMVWTCPGLLWYLTRLHYGPVTTNYLTNPNFTTNLTGWTTFGPTVTATHSTAVRLRGPGAARLVSTSSADNFIQQTITIPDTGGVGVFLAVAGLYWVDPNVTYVAGAFEERGLYVQSPSAIPTSEANWEPINMNSGVGIPTRVETGVQLPANVINAQVNVRAYGPHGAILWSAMSTTALESVSSEPTGTDVTEMMRRSFAYALTKFNLNIGTSTPAAGVTEIIAYQFKDLANIFTTMQTYPARGLADFSIETTSTTRTFTTYAPRKGSLKSANTVTIPGSAVNLVSYQRDGQQTSTRVIRRGAGDGSDREVGVATDAAALDGLILEDVGDAPPEMAIDGLDGLATTDLARLKDLVSIPEFDVPAAGWVGVVSPGDTVPVTINWGDVQDVTTRRVVSMVLDPKTDRVKVGVQVS